jgi:hypothetical protein
VTQVVAADPASESAAAAESGWAAPESTAPLDPELEPPAPDSPAPLDPGPITPPLLDPEASSPPSSPAGGGGTSGKPRRLVHAATPTRSAAKAPAKSLRGLPI